MRQGNGKDKVVDGLAAKSRGILFKMRLARASHPSQAPTSMFSIQLLIATGTTPRRLPIDGANLENIVTLRSYDDLKALDEAAKLDTYVAVVGSSFIAMEAAAGFAKNGAKVTVIGRVRSQHHPSRGTN